MEVLQILYISLEILKIDKWILISLVFQHMEVQIAKLFISQSIFEINNVKKTKKYKNSAYLTTR